MQANIYVEDQSTRQQSTIKEKSGRVGEGNLGVLDPLRFYHRDGCGYCGEIRYKGG